MIERGVFGDCVMLFLFLLFEFIIVFEKFLIILEKIIVEC